MRLQDKVTIITGAGGGMGRVAAQLFAAEGARIVVAEFNEAAGEETAELVRAAGGQATYVKVDVSKESDAKAMVDHAVATYGRLDCLYNNAGIMPEADHSVTDTDVATWDSVMAVNVRGVFLGMRHGLPVMIAQGSGSIINTSSVTAVRAIAGMGAYSAGKHAIVGLTRVGAVEAGPHGVRVNALLPGPTATPLIGDRTFEGRVPLGRVSDPVEQARVVCFLASDDSSYVNGETILVDGGMAYSDPP